MITETDLRIAERLKGIRLNKNIKQELAYVMVGLSSQQEYSKLENGKIHFDDEMIQKISQGFNISPEDLLSSVNRNYFNNSPSSNNLNYSTNSTFNDLSLINELLASKDAVINALNGIIKMKDELIENLKNKV